jgi:type II secretory pathway pseudopilin PulG
MCRRHTQQLGFSLIELQVSLCIILCLMLVARLAFWPAFQKAQQTDTMSRIVAVGNAMELYLIDNEMIPRGATDPVEIGDYIQISPTDLEFLCPRYIGRIPVIDRWGQPIEYYFNNPHDPGFLSGPQRVFLARSAGADGVFESNSYALGAFPGTEYGGDIVWTDGQFARRPNR